MKDCELGAIVNKELQQRVRPVNGVTAHRSVAKADIKHCAKIVQNFDERWNLWVESEEERKDREKKVLKSNIFYFPPRGNMWNCPTSYTVL